MLVTQDHDHVRVLGGEIEAPALAAAGAVEIGAAPAAGIPGPLFILAPPRSYTSLVCTMLGQHPQMYGLPELHLFSVETMAEWWGSVVKRNPRRTHGALRVVAQLYFGEQTEETVREAYGWLRRRSHLSTGLFLEQVAERVYPKMLVEKSPSNTRTVEAMQRAHRMFPRARFIHLLRHPRPQAESTLAHRERKLTNGFPVARFWHDPPEGWYANHTTICRFLRSINQDDSIRVRGEDLLSDPDRVVRSILEWLGLRTDLEAMDAVMHPERSPYACIGPKGALFGNNGNFLKNPRFNPAPVKRANLDDPLSWHPARGFPPYVKRLARHFGYQ